MRKHLGAVIFGVLTCGAVLPAAQPPAVAPPKATLSEPLVEFDRERLEVRIRLPAPAGRVSWNDIARGLVKARGWDDELLEGLPTQTFPLDSSITQFQFTLYNQLFSPHLRFEIARDAGGQPIELQVLADREALLSSRRRFSTWIREKLSRPFSGQRYGLRWDARWQDRPLDAEAWRTMPAHQTAVVFIHGFQSRGSSLDQLMAGPRAAGFPCGVFDYPNDQALADSASALSKALQEFRQRNAQPLVLVTHSMGGLVARAVLEDPQLAPSGVRRLIMVAPPNQGSALAHFHFGLDLWEYISSPERREQARLISGAIEDGLSEASRDLQPGSVFLERLDHGQRNPDIQYTILLGDKGLLLPEERSAMCQRLQDATASNRWAEFFGRQANQWLADLDEVVVGLGDGAVAVKRGRLDGVQDVHILPFGHLSVLEPSQPFAGALGQLLMDRIAAPPP